MRKSAQNFGVDQIAEINNRFIMLMALIMPMALMVPIKLAILMVLMVLFVLRGAVFGADAGFLARAGTWH